MAGNMHGGGHAWQGVCMEGEMATAADGMHPTGMHSCFSIKIAIKFYKRILC